MKTRAAILVEQKKPLVIEEVEVPTLKLGQVLVKVLASGICGSQIGEINGVKGPDRFLPHLLDENRGTGFHESGILVRQGYIGTHAEGRVAVPCPA